MPEISRFYGITIHIYFEDHSPAHIHARYGEYDVKIVLETLEIQGDIPSTAKKLIKK